MSVALLVFAFLFLDSFPTGRRWWLAVAWCVGMLLLVGGAVVLERGWP